MKGNKVTKLFGKITSFADNHQREILLGCTIVGVISTGVLAWKNAPKAKEIIDKHKKAMDEIPEENKEERNKEIFETVKDLAPLVLPPIVTGGLTILTAIGGHSASSKQIAALSAAYNLSKDALSDYKDKAMEILGDKKASSIKDAISQDKVVNTPPPDDSKLILQTGRGTTLCLDDASGRYFYSSAEEIRKASNRINKRIMDEYYISLNEFYDELGLEECTLGDFLGFNVDDGLIDIDHLFRCCLYRDDIPCLVLDLNDYISPKYLEHKGGMFK